MAEALVHTEGRYREELMKVIMVSDEDAVHDIIEKDLLEKFLFGLSIRQNGASPSSGFHFTYEHYESRLPLLLC